METSEKACKLEDKGKSCCGGNSVEEDLNLKNHWNQRYSNSPEESLGWYEMDLSPSLHLIEKTGIAKNSRILIVGSGSTTLIDALLDKGHTHLIATDISEVALGKLKSRLGESCVEYITDDLTKPVVLNSITPVSLWIDRAVLHFFTEKKDQETYFDLVKKKVQTGGYALFAEYNLTGATKCAGLPVYRYNEPMLAERLGPDFQLIESFDYTYTMPSGELRPYLYALYLRN